MGENICKGYDRQELNFQNIQTAHANHKGGRGNRNKFSEGYEHFEK